MPLMSRVALAVISVSLAAALVVLFRAEDGSAHAAYDRSVPAAGDTVDPAPELVEVWFTQEIDSRGTVITVVGPTGDQVDLGDTTLDLFDPTRKRITVSLRPDLGPGTYTVRWTSLSAEDGEEDSGAFTFVVAGDPVSASPIASPVASPVASSVATPAPAA